MVEPESAVCVLTLPNTSRSAASHVGRKPAQKEQRRVKGFIPEQSVNMSRVYLLKYKTKLKNKLNSLKIFHQCYNIFCF